MAANNGASTEVRQLQVPVESLLLDAHNPRLASGAGGDGEMSQEELVRILWEEMAVDEVAFSIAANGYYWEERLLVIPMENSKGEHYIVVEGNRRLAAVMLLLDAALRQRVKATVLPEISEERQRRISILPISIYPSRESLWSYLGFRHINGTKPWDSFSKAKYVAEVHETYGVPLQEIANRIGDQHSTVIRLYRGIKVLEQAEHQSGFDADDRVKSKFSFSHLYTAVQQPEFQKFLGITPEGSLRPDPVPRNKMSELAQLMVWLYGKKSTNTSPLIQSQNPDLNTLREVISKPSSLSALRTGLSLDTAFEIGLGDARRFRDALTRAGEELRQAKGTVTTGYDGEHDMLLLIEDIAKLAVSIEREMAEIAQSSRRGRSRSGPR